MRLPVHLTTESFLSEHWQKQPLFVPGAVDGPSPALTRDELGWLATLEDVESRIVFTERSADRVRYRAETGPFDESFLTKLPERDWTLLVHDVEKHLPELRALFAYVPFVPDWRIDDLMVSFAAPGGGVGPHKDNYDVFLVQGDGTRDWHFTTKSVLPDRKASDDLALLEAFAGESVAAQRGDILYLPPGAAHWGTATQACLTYSIGMRAPQLSELVDELPDHETLNPFYEDPDLSLSEVAPGYISNEARGRAERLTTNSLPSTALGRAATLTKDWLAPENATNADADSLILSLQNGADLSVHGMARIAWDHAHVYVNGHAFPIAPEVHDLLPRICDARLVRGPLQGGENALQTLHWMMRHGAFELPEN